jgi:hypothetical protein
MNAMGEQGGGQRIARQSAEAAAIEGEGDRPGAVDPAMLACAHGCHDGLVGEEARTSFLKKRSKKLLRLRPCRQADTVRTTRTARSKSFLVLFFKKEPLPSPLLMAPPRPSSN